MFKSSIRVVVLCASFAPQCATAAPDMGTAPSSPSMAPARSVADLCGRDAAKRYVGTVADAPVRNAVAKAVGHTGIRWIRPGEAVTQDYRADRLNVITDNAGRILTVRCG